MSRSEIESALVRVLQEQQRLADDCAQEFERLSTFYCTLLEATASVNEILRQVRQAVELEVDPADFWKQGADDE